MIEWRFKPNSRDDMDVDPIQGEFFTTSDVDNISNAVVREGIQNALDERNKDGQSETIRVRIFLSGDKYALSAQQYEPLLKTLMPHLHAKNSGISTPPDYTKKMRFLAFEDFNTNGLEGDPEESYIENNSDKLAHNFYYFWRNVGRSGKTDEKLGRWGLGKTVFPASSEINTFWGLTVRKSDKKKMLLGQSVLRIHNREDDKKVPSGYRPYGMFGKYNDNEYFASPVEDENDLAQFEKLFHLQRKDQTGLSLVIPFCTEEITIDQLTYSVIEQYFYPILEGKLVVEVAEADNFIILERSSMQDAIDKINFEALGKDNKKIKSKENLIKLFDFAKWTFQLTDEEYLKLNALNLDQQPRWYKSLFDDKETLDIFREKFDQGERIGIKVPLKYQPVNGHPKICWYNAYLEKDSTLVKPENLFVRDGITISGIISLDRGLVRGIVIIHDIDLARMLGDSENPAHTEWQPDSRNFKGKYIHGKESLVFVKNTLKKLYENLQRPLEGIQKDLLIDFFSIPIQIEVEKKEKKLPKPKIKGEEDVEEPEIEEWTPRSRSLIIEKIHSGFKILKNPSATDLPESVRVRMGYDVPRGNPIKSYQELDFDVSKKPIAVESSGIIFIKNEKNEIEFEISNSEEFELKLTGFDSKRDLYIKM